MDNTSWSWERLQNVHSFKNFVDRCFKWHEEDRIALYLPTELPPFRLNRYEIIAVYYMIEVWWDRGGWLHERPSNKRRGKMSGHVGEMTYIQICDMFKKYSPFELYGVKRWLIDLRWEDFSFEQKLLYFWLIRKWGLVK